MSKLKLHPDKAGYAVDRGTEIISAKLDGGASKIRKDILNAAFRVSVQWITHPDGYNYLNAFYRTSTANGSLPFTIDLYLDKSEPVEFSAQFVPDTFKLSSQSGETYYVSAELEVTKPFNGSEASEDAATIAAFEAAYPYQV